MCWCRNGVQKLLFSLFRSDKGVAVVQRLKNQTFFRRTVQQNAYPMQFVEVVAGYKSLLRKQNLVRKGFAFYVENVHRPLSRKPQTATRNVHNYPVPFARFRSAQNGVVGYVRPKIFGLSAVLICGVVKYVLSCCSVVFCHFFAVVRSQDFCGNVRRYFFTNVLVNISAAVRPQSLPAFAAIRDNVVKSFNVLYHKLARNSTKRQNRTLRSKTIFAKWASSGAQNNISLQIVLKRLIFLYLFDRIIKVDGTIAKW